MDKLLYPNNAVQCILTGPSECGKSVFLTKLTLNFINEYDKIYIYSPSIHQDLYQKRIKCINNYIPTYINPNILNEGDIDIVFEERDNDKNFEKPDTQIEIDESIEEIKYLQDYEDRAIIILED